MSIFKFSKILLSFIIIFFDKIIFLLPSRKYRKNYLAIVKIDAIGDFIIWINTAKNLSLNNKNKKLILICDKNVEEIANSLNYFEKIISINTKKFVNNLFYRFKKILIIRKFQYYKAIQTTYSRNFLTGDSIIRATNAQQRIGVKGDNTNQVRIQKIISNGWYTSLIKFKDSSLSEKDRNDEFLRTIGIKEIIKNSKIPTLTNLKEEFTYKNPYIIIFPGASTYKRMWPIKFFAKIASYISLNYSLKIIICGSQSEYNLGETLKEISTKSDIVNLAGKTNLLEFIEIVRNSELLIGNETSAIHIAYAVNTKSICLLGGGHFGRFMPYPLRNDPFEPIPIFEDLDCFKCNWNCTIEHPKGAPYPCISELSPNKVLPILKELLENYRNNY